MLALRRLPRQACSCSRPFFAYVTRSLSSSTPTASTQTASNPLEQNEDEQAPITHYKITLRRSPISLGARIKATLVSLGIHRRMQTVYFPHSPIVAGKILRVKELVEVENVPAHAVQTKEEQTKERKPPRGYVVVGSRMSGRVAAQVW